MQTNLITNQWYSLEDYRGFLLCIEPAGHKKRAAARVAATRSRPGPWEMVCFQPIKSNKKKKQLNPQGDILTSKTTINVVSAHNTALHVDQPGLVTPEPRKKGTSFHAEFHKGYLALKGTDGRYLGTTKSGKLICNRYKGNRGPPQMYLFRVFARKQEFDDPRAYIPLGYKGVVTKSFGPTPTFDDVVVELCGRFLLSLPAEELQVVHRLFFQIEQMWWFYEDHKSDHHSHLPHMDHQEFGRQVFRLCDLFDPVRSQYDALYAAFKTYLLSVPVFGVFIMNQLMNKVVLVKSYNGSWLGFPRGKVNQNEAEVECAVREAEEEIGVDLQGKLEQNSYLQFPEGQKSVKLFLVDGVDENTTEFQTQTRKEIGNISWYDLSKAKSLLPTDQWKYLNTWIRNKKKLNKHKKKINKNNKNANHNNNNNNNNNNSNNNNSNNSNTNTNTGKVNKNNNWQQNWGMDAMLAGVDGGGGHFIDEEYDDKGYARSGSPAKTSKTPPQAKKNKKRPSTQNRNKGNDKRKVVQTKTRPVKILTKKKTLSNAWKNDNIFQGSKFGKFQFNRKKILNCLPVL